MVDVHVVRFDGKTADPAHIPVPIDDRPAEATRDAKVPGRGPFLL
jgi:hypothetical protein